MLNVKSPLFPMYIRRVNNFAPDWTHLRSGRSVQGQPSWVKPSRGVQILSQRYRYEFFFDFFFSSGSMWVSASWRWTTSSEFSYRSNLSWCWGKVVATSRLASLLNRVEIALIYDTQRGIPGVYVMCVWRLQLKIVGKYIFSLMPRLTLCCFLLAGLIVARRV